MGGIISSNTRTAEHDEALEVPGPERTPGAGPAHSAQLNHRPPSHDSLFTLKTPKVIKNT